MTEFKDGEYVRFSLDNNIYKVLSLSSETGMLINTFSSNPDLADLTYFNLNTGLSHAYPEDNLYIAHLTKLEKTQMLISTDLYNG